MAAVALFSCGPKDSAVIDLNVADAGGKEIVLSKLNVNAISVVDTLTLDANGGVKCNVAVAEDAPDFYYLSYNRKRIASLLLKGGDNVKVSVDTLGGNLNIEGSEESVLLAASEKKMYDFSVKFDSLSNVLLNAIEAKDKKAEEKLQYELGNLFIKYKRGAVVDIMKNPFSLVNVSILYQQLNPNLPIFGDLNDVAYFQRGYDSLVTVYPNSVYVKSLSDELNKRYGIMAMNNKIKEAGELAYPEISLPDTKGQEQKLSALAGKPFILVFWTTANAEQKMFNHELKELYAKYSPKGLQIYQVAVDVDKAMWATVVKEQELPWVNVCDGLGTASLALNTYNISKVPTLFVFDKEGNIIAKDVFNKASLDKTLSGLAY